LTTPLNVEIAQPQGTLSVVDLFDVDEGDTVWDAWLAAVNLLDMVERTHKVEYDFEGARRKISDVCAMADRHGIDRRRCGCGLSDAEHSILKRKILKFYRLQVSNLKHFVY
jgi:hypothetical protein